MPPRVGSFATSIATLLLANAACVHAPRIVLPADAPITAAKESPRLEIGDSEKPTPENPFTSDAIIPCRDADDRAQARKAIESLAAQITQLDEASPPSALEKAQRHLQTLLDTPCFELAKADLREPLELDSAFALRHWWWDGGGEYSLYRRVGTEADDQYPTIMLPGQPVPSLLFLGHETHPLAPLLCPATDYTCGRDTRGWVRRTTRAFADERRAIDPTECEKNLLNDEPEKRWSNLVDCEIASAPMLTMLPLGRFRAMNDGYFVFTEPPDGNCSMIRVYDLASGTTIRSQSCSRNAVDVVEIGRVSLAPLREAAWMMALSAYAQDNVRQSTSFTIPDGVAPGRLRERVDHRTHYASRRRSSQTAWTWYRRSGAKMVAQVTGTTVSASSWTAGRYANELFHIADDSFEAGCAPAFSSAVLASIPWKQSGPMVHEKVNLPFDFQSSDLDAARAAIPAAKPPPKCTSPL